ncbi:protein FAR1-RELATED SEQUENCE 6-like isoform X2 [Ananas comosus]|nr:protein FAR1-RELATED SEQUENCE 6-like isoform X2 [Ananas comosus]
MENLFRDSSDSSSPSDRGGGGDESERSLEREIASDGSYDSHGEESEDKGGGGEDNDNAEDRDGDDDPSAEEEADDSTEKPEAIADTHEDGNNDDDPVRTPDVQCIQKREYYSEEEDEENEYIPKDLDDALTPRVGMVFGSVNEAFGFYKTYAYRTGFTAVRRTSHNLDGTRYSSTFACIRAGKPTFDPYRKLDPFPRNRRRQSDKKTECRATMVVKDARLKNRWRVQFLELRHNHPCEPDMVRFMKCFRELPDSVKERHKISEGNLGESLKKSFNAATQGRRCTINPRKGGSRMEGGIRFKAGDIEALLKFFDSMQAKDPNFFYNWDLDQEGRLRKVFWADARSRAAYHFYGDVIAVETMCFSGQPASHLAALVGVNNHGQLVLLGCAVFSDEAKETYAWLLTKWLRCMDGKPPEAVIIPYSEAIAEAVAEVIPGARCRFCVWNIMRKIHERMVLQDRDVICSKFKKVVFDTITITDFENVWGKVIEKHRLGNDAWLSSLYEHRKQWAPVFVNHSFWAGMSTIKRNEKFDTFFEGQMSSKTSLKAFLDQYDAVLKSRLEKETYEDLQSFYSRPQILSGFQFEEQIADLYTVNIYQKFQNEVKQLMHVICKEADRSGPTVTYMVSELAEGKKVDYTVVYNNAEKDAWCICRSFQFRGILCSHVLAVLRQEYVMLIPPKYILDRWKKDFKRIHVTTNSPNEAMVRDLRSYDDVYKRGHRFFADIVDLGSLEPELKEFVLSVMKDVRDKMVRYVEMQAERLVDVNMASTGNVVNVNMENEQLSMAPTDFMQVHRTDFPQKRFNTQRDKTVEDANKRLNMQRGIYFTSSGMHV